MRAQYEANPYPRWLDINPPQPGAQRTQLRRHLRPEDATRFADDPQTLDLEKLERFEADNPDTFAGMIAFWCRRPS